MTDPTPAERVAREIARDIHRVSCDEEPPSECMDCDIFTERIAARLAPLMKAVEAVVESDRQALAELKAMGHRDLPDTSLVMRLRAAYADLTGEKT